MRWIMPVVGAVIVGLAASCGPTVAMCKSDSDCVSGQRCDPASELCVNADASVGGDDAGTEGPTLTGGALPDALVNQPYEHTVTATGGTPPYNWLIESGAPSWLSLDAETGVLSGTPTSLAAAITFKVKVTDAENQSASADYSILVRSCTDGEQVDCSMASAGTCALGKRTCTSGELGDCTGLSPSTNASVCGAGCSPCDPTIADTCTTGECTCGGSASCASSERCCGGSCINVGDDVGNCGGCGMACDSTRANVEERCVSGTCDYPCAPGFGRCAPNSNAPGCDVDLQNDVNNCGACGNACTTPTNATAVACVQGQCQVTVCATGFGDCDTSFSNGCEVDVSADPDHCGSCTNVCSPVVQATRTCVSGSCKASCNVGHGDCDGLYGTGCEINLTNTLNHCGTCGNVCQTKPNSTVSCTSSQCSYTCTGPYLNCDSNFATNGCEVDGSTNMQHCGACGNACTPRPNATGVTCASGNCALGPCNAGFANCNGLYSDGCEVNITSNVAHCGGCGQVCPKPGMVNVAAGTCTSGNCFIGTCSANYGNCDGNQSNGCETNLLNTKAHCGGCGNACKVSEACIQGVCEAL